VSNIIFWYFQEQVSYTFRMNRKCLKGWIKWIVWLELSVVFSLSLGLELVVFLAWV
jgi:hypothetical protein